MRSVHFEYFKTFDEFVGILQTWIFYADVQLLHTMSSTLCEIEYGFEN